MGGDEVVAPQLRNAVSAECLPQRAHLPEAHSVSIDDLPTGQIQVFDRHTATAATEVGTSFLDDPRDVAHLVGLFDQVAGTAVYGEDARRVLGALAAG